MIRRFALLACVICLLPVMFSLQPARAEEPVVPNFWDPKERLAKPDLSQLQRLRFITTTDFAPFNFIDASGRLSGFHVDLARAICAELEIADRCQIQALPWAEHEKALVDGEGEAILAGLGVSEETRRLYAFTRPYLAFPARFVTRQAASFQPDAETLKNKTVGVIAGSSQERMLRDYFPDAKVQTFDALDALLAAVQAGMIDAAFGDAMRMSFWLAERQTGDCCGFAGGPYLAPDYLGEGLAIAVPRDRPELKQALDYALQQISVKGTFAELYLRYFPISFF